MHILGNKKQQGTTLVLHVGSSSVGSMVIKHSPDDKIEILSHSKIPTNFLLDVDFQAFWRSVSNSLKNSLAETAKQFKGKPDSAICVFTSPWFISQTKVATIKRDEDFLTTEDIFNKLVKNEIEIFLKQWQGNMDPLGGRANLIEYKIMKVNLNGYPAQKPLKKRVKNLEAFIYISLGVNEVMETIKQELHDKFGKMPVQFHTFPFVTFNVLSQIVNTEGGILFTEIGGETTDLSIVRKNVIEETISFRRGKNHLVRKIASDAKTFIEEVPSILEAYHKKQLSEEASAKIKKITEEAAADWTNLLKDSLKIISDNFPLPQNLFIIGDSVTNQELTSNIENNKDLSQYTVFEKPFNVTRVNTEQFEKFYLNKDFFDFRNDIFLTIEGVFADKFTGN